MCLVLPSLVAAAFLANKDVYNCVSVKPKCYYAYNKVESRAVTKQNLSEQVLDNIAYAIIVYRGKLCTL